MQRPAASRPAVGRQPIASAMKAHLVNTSSLLLRQEDDAAGVEPSVRWADLVIGDATRY